MELGLSLGDSSKPSFNTHLGLGLNTTLSIGPTITAKSCDHHLQQEDDIEDEEEEEEEEDSDDEAKKEKRNNSRRSSIIDHEASNKLIPAVSVSPKAILHNSSLQLHLLPRTPVPPLLSSFPWPPPSDHNNSGEVAGSSRVPSAVEEESEERAALSSSPNSAASSFQVDLCMYSKGGRGSSSMSMSGSGNIKKTNNNSNMKMDSESETYYDQKGGCRGSDEEDNVGTRKKLRLSKEQSAFLEDSFKEHPTLNPKQKLALAKQLNLRPRQVEVWFQNRRARTKLKQTEVECEYLKRWCETLSEENRRLEKELQEVKALKASSSNPFFMQLPATTLTMCPSCERVAPNPTSNSNSSSTSKSLPNAFPLVHAKPKFYPFPHSKPHRQYS